MKVDEQKIIHAIDTICNDEQLGIAERIKM